MFEEGEKMNTDRLERYIQSRNEAREKIKRAIIEQSLPPEEILDAVDQLQIEERSLCIAIVQDKEDQVRDEIGDNSNPTDWHMGQLAMSRRCVVSLEHNRHWQTFYREKRCQRK